MGTGMGNANTVPSMGIKVKQFFRFYLLLLHCATRKVKAHQEIHLQALGDSSCGTSRVSKPFKKCPNSTGGLSGNIE
jgi:hypothetical protein